MLQQTNNEELLVWQKEENLFRLNYFVSFFHVWHCKQLEKINKLITVGGMIWFSSQVRLASMNQFNQKLLPNFHSIPAIHSNLHFICSNFLHQKFLGNSVFKAFWSPEKQCDGKIPGQSWFVIRLYNSTNNAMEFVYGNTRSLDNKFPSQNKSYC